MDFVVVRTKINKKKSSFFFVMLGPWVTYGGSVKKYAQTTPLADGISFFLVLTNELILK
jgi:hypothetical protein